jgi:hypothetical protein
MYADQGHMLPRLPRFPVLRRLLCQLQLIHARNAASLSRIIGNTVPIAALLCNLPERVLFI